MIPSFELRERMKKTSKRTPITLFYSYSHSDRAHRRRMEKTLSLLKTSAGLESWSDEAIVPGTDWSEEIRCRLEAATIVVFLMSIDFVASEPCLREWEMAVDLAKESDRYLIPIVLDECPWKDVPHMANRQALPEDARPIADYESESHAWMQVYEGIKRTMEHATSNVSDPG